MTDRPVRIGYVSPQCCEAPAELRYILCESPGAGIDDYEIGDYDLGGGR